MKITVHNESIINATGKHNNRNAKPVFCITTGEVFASLADAAENVGVTPSSMSWAVNDRMKTCKGKRFCLIANVTDHLDEIAETIRIREEKLAKYNAIIAEEERIRAEQEAKRKAQEELTKRKAEYEKKLAALEEAERLLREAEANVKEEI